MRKLDKRQEHCNQNLYGAETDSNLSFMMSSLINELI